MNNILDLKPILEMSDNAERRLLLIIRGWQMQRNESKSDQERAFCNEMLAPERVKGLISARSK